jgi:hypothetical protein
MSAAVCKWDLILLVCACVAVICCACFLPALGGVWVLVFLQCRAVVHDDKLPVAHGPIWCGQQAALYAFAFALYLATLYCQQHPELLVVEAAVRALVLACMHTLYVHCVAVQLNAGLSGTFCSNRAWSASLSLGDKPPVARGPILCGQQAALYVFTHLALVALPLCSVSSILSFWLLRQLPVHLVLACMHTLYVHCVAVQLTAGLSGTYCSNRAWSFSPRDKPPVAQSLIWCGQQAALYPVHSYALVALPLYSVILSICCRGSCPCIGACMHARCTCTVLPCS